MSGGVDSTAAALLLREQAEVRGFFMRLAQPDFQRQKERVSRLADRLGIELEVIDLREAFSRRVLDYFAGTYFDGRTPNPCMVCNREVKFGLFLEAIMDAGMDKMATGHYARIICDDAGLFHLHDGVDPAKNQSYFLSRLSQKQLGSVVFPLGEQKKTDTYALVERCGFTGFSTTGESQDVCFLADDTVGGFLENSYPEAVRPGPIVSMEGVRLGEHTGLFRYTIGQRRGLGLPDSSPWYVTGMDAVTNTLIVGKSDNLFKDVIEAGDLHWISGEPPATGSVCTVRIRYSHRGSPARIEPAAGETVRIIFSEKQRAVTPGQFAVFCNGTEVLGSGVISSGYTLG